ncbi:hypothetical protein BV20DRAFT_580801 [Pilatotrama ljubarskyi]|nr:hypothetical protein BV20DRAFT_580801 [Pilatotrama ljubarskyi]
MRVPAERLKLRGIRRVRDLLATVPGSRRMARAQAVVAVVVFVDNAVPSPGRGEAGGRAGGSGDQRRSIIASHLLYPVNLASRRVLPLLASGADRSRGCSQSALDPGPALCSGPHHLAVRARADGCGHAVAFMYTRAYSGRMPEACCAADSHVRPPQISAYQEPRSDGPAEARLCAER